MKSMDSSICVLQARRLCVLSLVIHAGTGRVLAAARGVRLMGLGTEYWSWESDLQYD